MPQKSRYSVEEKVKLVCEYMSGQLSPSGFEHTYGVNQRVLRDWVRLYKMRGAEGLTPAMHTRKYLPETKRSAVLDYLNGFGSADDICTKYDISDRKIFRRWIKRYNSHGYFNQRNSGGVIYMAKGRTTTLAERIEIVSYCIAKNKDYGKAVEQYGISYQQIYGWVRKYEKGGPCALDDRRGKGKDEASMTEIEKLRAQLKLKEAENLRLQMENDLLKKLEALERGIDID
jgi:transposase